MTGVNFDHVQHSNSQRELPSRIDVNQATFAIGRLRNYKIAFFALTLATNFAC
jgi:hypothetical protein